MKRSRKKHPPSALILIVCALLFFAATYLASPWTPVFSLRPQNRCFSVRRLIAENHGNTTLVTAEITARNPLPWGLTFDRVDLQSMGEYTAVLGSCQTECDKPVTIGGWASEDIAVFYEFDEARFLSEYADAWPEERNPASPDAASCVEDFLRHVNFVFHSDALPGGEARCFTSDQTRDYERRP